MVGGVDLVSALFGEDEGGPSISNGLYQLELI